MSRQVQQDVALLREGRPEEVACSVPDCVVCPGRREACAQFDAALARVIALAEHAALLTVSDADMPRDDRDRALSLIERAAEGRGRTDTKLVIDYLRIVNHGLLDALNAVRAQLAEQKDGAK